MTNEPPPVDSGGESPTIPGNDSTHSLPRVYLQLLYGRAMRVVMS